MHLPCPLPCNGRRTGRSGALVLGHLGPQHEEEGAPVLPAPAAGGLDVKGSMCVQLA